MRARFPVAPARALAALLLLATAAVPARAGEPAAPDGLPPAFVENRGQWPAADLFEARRPGMAVRVRADGLHLALFGNGGARLVRLLLDGGEPEGVEGLDALPGAYHFLRGAEPVRGARSFARVRLRGVADGADLVLRDAGGVLEYDLVLAPGASAEGWAMRVEGADAWSIEADGTLVIATDAGELRQSAPVAWQVDAAGEHRPVASRFRRIDERRFGLAVERPDPAAATVIDPGLVWSSFLGGSTSNDIIKAVAVDSAGDVLVAGHTKTTDFPVTTGAYQTTFAGPTHDCFVAKFGADGTTLEWATYVGGSLNDQAEALAIDSADRPVVAGHTISSDFPTTAGALQETYEGFGDGVVFRLSDDGSTLEWSTYLAGSRADSARAIAIDGAGTVIVGGVTHSTIFPFDDGTPATVHPHPFVDGGFVTWLSSTGGYAGNRFLAGSSGDQVYGVADAGGGLAYAVGATGSDDFPVTAGALKTTKVLTEGFVVKCGPGSGAPAWGTYLGGSGSDEACAVDANSAGEAVVVGFTRSTDFPTTVGAFQTTFGGGQRDAYVAVLETDGSALASSTFLGGGDSEDAFAVEVSGADQVYVVGRTFSGDFPTTPCAYQSGEGAPAKAAAYLSRLSADLTSLVYSTNVAGLAHDVAYGLALHSSGDVFLGGDTLSADYPITAGVPDATHGGGTDAFLTRLDPTPSSSAAWSNYGAGWPGTLGVPSLTASAPPVLGTTVTIDIGDSTGVGTLVFLFLGTGPASVPIADGTLLTTSDLLFGLSFPIPAGGISLPYVVPSDSSFCGTTLYLQVLEIDAGASSFVSFSPGLELLLGG